MIMEDINYTVYTGYFHKIPNILTNGIFFVVNG